ncbi:hypothetical protein BDQ12DRAFT_655917 [Crucibulum laeve]|uniref:Uncharacterized protein n=1 Tax=Crucibulum laeve TaxID=68775 RepID=A0A5C3LR13_9AGAR|nr:hypothetical protein BDQ12DRAFT_655917 [Crucibulum laeve]
MANLLRSAKSGSDWTRNEFFAYNITIVPVPPQQFFHSGADPSLDHLDSVILTASPGADDTSYSDVGYLDLATSATQESLINDFAAQTLKLLGFNERHIIISTRFIIPLTICGESKRTAEMDVCLLHRPTMVLLVLVEDKTLSNNTNAESQVVAEANAIFQFNNDKRKRKGLPRLKVMTIPCITMSGTRPTFYLVPVTEELSNAVISGKYPGNQTKVLKCVTVAGHTRRASEGMEDAEYRKLAFKRFLAFKTLAKSCWSEFLEGY